MASGSDTVIHLYEDDTPLACEIVAAFAAENRRVEQVATQPDLVALLRTDTMAVLIMDRMVGDVDSLDVLASIRAEGHRAPVLVISSLSTVDDRILGLKAGGDDYLTKPFAMGELIARVEALLRRAVPERATVLSVGPLVVDLIARSVRRGRRDIALLPREFSLLEYLMRHAGVSVTRAMLLEDVWNYRVSTQTNVVDVHVGNLRRKIDADGEPRLIESVRGVGFRLRADNDDPAS